MLSKHHRLPFPKSDSMSCTPFHLIHVDLWDPYKQSTLNGAHYFFTIVDDNTRATWTYLVHSKEQIPSLSVSFFAYVENHFQKQPKIVRSDNGIEIVNKACAFSFNQEEYCTKSAFPTPHSRMTGLRENLGICLIMLEPLDYMPIYLLSFGYLINKMSAKVLDWKSPFEKLYGTPPNYDHLRVIGCLCYAAITKPHKDKFANRGV